MRLIIIEVASGKGHVKLFFFIYMSPGRWPNHLKLPPKVKKTPNPNKNKPNVTKNLASPEISFIGNS
jgi:hypothetical protein